MESALCRLVREAGWRVVAGFLAATKPAAAGRYGPRYGAGCVGSTLTPLLDSLGWSRAHAALKLIDMDPIIIRPRNAGNACDIAHRNAGVA
jgi:hypothetical protein